MIEDETPAEGVEEAPAEGEPQPVDEHGDVIAPPADDAPAEGTDENPPSEGDPDAPADLEFADAEVDPDAEVVDGEVVPASVGESQSLGEGGETEVVGGESEPQVLSSGDELPAHRQRVDSGEATVE